MDSIQLLAALLCLTILPNASAAPQLIESVALSGCTAQPALETRAGGPLEEAAITRDLRKLYSTGRFSDIRVRSADGPHGKHVTFEVTEAPRLLLRSIRTEPESITGFRFKAEISPATPADARSAQAIAAEYRRQLSAQGHPTASVTPEIRPISSSRADLILHIATAGPVKLAGAELQGDPGLNRKHLRPVLKQLEPLRIVPGIPRVWRGWSIAEPYSPDVVDSAIVRLRSLYLARGYFDATVRKDHTAIVHGQATVKFVVKPGSHHPIESWQVRGDGLASRPFDPRKLCDCLFRLRRESEKQGVLDFGARLTLEPGAAGRPANLNVTVERGPTYRVRRIQFAGNRRFSDTSMRRNVLLREGEPLNSILLRKSLARLNRSSLFEPLDESKVQIMTDSSTGLADVRVRVKERKVGFWMLSGGLGPTSVAGPMQFALGSRLPSWGRGVLDLSAWTASLSLASYANPWAGFLGGRPARKVIPVAVLQRPYDPGQAWMSGVTIASQLGWRRALLSYGSTQMRERMLLPWTSGPVRESQLVIAMDRHPGDNAMICEPPEPRLKWLRRGVGLAMQFAGATLGF